jgi:hypothetical protein
MEGTRSGPRKKPANLAKQQATDKPINPRERSLEASGEQQLSFPFHGQIKTEKRKSRKG